MARAMPRLRPRALAALVLATSAVATYALPQTTTNSIPFGVDGHSSASGDITPNAAVRPQEPPRASSLDRVFELINTTADNKSLVNPFTPETAVLKAEESSPSPAPTPTPTLTPTPTPTVIGTSTSTPTPSESSTTTTAPKSLTEAPPTSADSGSNRRADAGPATASIFKESVTAETPTSAPTAETPTSAPTAETPTSAPTAVVKRTTNAIAFDVVSPATAERSPPAPNAASPSPARSPAPAWSAPPTASAASGAPSTPGRPSAPAAAPTALAPRPTAAAASEVSPPPPAPGAPPPPPAAPAGPGSPAAPTATPKAPGAPGAVAAPAAPGTSPRPGSAPSPGSPSSANTPPGVVKPADNPNTAVVADSVTSTSTSVTAGSLSSTSTSVTAGSLSSSSQSSSVGPSVGQGARAKMSDSSGSNATVETASQTATSRYSMGLASILSIVGVVMGIGIIVTLFIMIGRRKYDDDDDDKDVLGYGGEGGFQIAAGRPSVVRLSPTFIVNGNGSQPDYSLPSPLQIMGSNRGARANSHGYAATGAVAANSPDSAVESSAPPLRRPHPPIEGGGRAPSAISSDDDISSMDRSSGWSSVMESEFDDMRSASRCTRDTNLSEYNAWEFTSQKTNRTNPARRTGGRVMAAAPVTEYSFDEEDDDLESVMSLDDSQRSGINLDTQRYGDTDRSGFNLDNAMRSSGDSIRTSSDSEFSEWSRRDSRT